MTKVALKAPVNGTGTVTLEAPETNANEVVEIPAGGGRMARADAAGMPLLDDGTPVVESGSNSDGEWTRWGDGTQTQRGLFTPSSGVDYVPLPKDYIGLLFIQITVYEPADQGAITARVNSVSSTSFNIRTASLSGTMTAGGVFFEASGRWK